ncbi:aminodeoxychorismate synthase component I [Nocardia mangyaensis]|uniref:aminodeoxychorismate synthase component I n=1 Tax=Nocardia mangyaensis TaxID=2213200 RepID=UPI0026776115|nr:aminodeoxychorismate synthase component I [Nocardia mangyaensis]MDO3648632.1 aminodeoxychorismate synthase component I [Nocardia mangyaensis]
MRTLLIDNYDSFTYNLYQLISEVNGNEPTVVRNDEAVELGELGLERFDNVVISPGPGRPDRVRDMGVSTAVIAHSELPLLGVCLGHQGIVLGAGGAVGRAPLARHGFLDQITHDDRELFAGLPQDFTVVRYHSLAALEPLPEVVEVTARTSDGVIMGVRHRERPQWGVQFHPESVSSEFGVALVRNFADLTKARAHSAAPVVVRGPVHVPMAAAPEHRFGLRHSVIERAIDTEAIFLRRYAESSTAFWLDSEHVEPGLDRFSFLGDAAGPHAEIVGYRVGDGAVTVTDEQGTRTVAGTVLDYLDRELRARHCETPALPFDFAGGYVGYLGYEVKADCGARAVHRSPTPDAQWIFADRLIVVDHEAGRTHLLALTEPVTEQAAQRWLRETEAALAELATWVNPADLPVPADPDAVQAHLVRGRDRYLADVAVCQERLHAGESYEICLTDAAAVAAAPDDGLDLYLRLRRCNPAPYAAYLRFDGLDVACSSPERFLKIDRDRMVESKPIKGTAPRGRTVTEDDHLRRTLADDPKTRAENLMIVDLLRNDLGRVCEVGSVHVPELMSTETYSTLHQLVSTVRGTLRRDAGVVDALRACFPGGSMTGAPKLRTMEILDELETEARGVYSGTIGFLGLGGTADLNIVIRTAVRYDDEWRIGAGGAIVLDSDPEDEYAEMVLKAAATFRALS